jgi:hypothetical protein
MKVNMLTCQLWEFEKDGKEVRAYQAKQLHRASGSPRSFDAWYKTYTQAKGLVKDVDYFDVNGEPCFSFEAGNSIHTNLTLGKDIYSEVIDYDEKRRLHNERVRNDETKAIWFCSIAFLLCAVFSLLQLL